MDAAARLDPEAKSIVPRRQGHRAEPPWPRAAGAERGGRQMGREEEAASPRHGRRGGEHARSPWQPRRRARGLPASAARAGVGGGPHRQLQGARAELAASYRALPRCAGRRGLWRAPAAARRPSPAREGREREGRAWPDPGHGSSARPPAEGGGGGRRKEEGAGPTGAARRPRRSRSGGGSRSGPARHTAAAGASGGSRGRGRGRRSRPPQLAMARAGPLPRRPLRLAIIRRVVRALVQRE